MRRRGPGCAGGRRLILGAGSPTTTDGRPVKIVSNSDEHTHERLGGLVERPPALWRNGTSIAMPPRGGSDGFVAGGSSMCGFVGAVCLAPHHGSERGAAARFGGPLHGDGRRMAV